jgi:hypothetical protein
LVDATRREALGDGVGVFRDLGEAMRWLTGGELGLPNSG